MRVTQITEKKDRKHTTFFADLIFSKPYGGKKKRAMFWLRWLYTLFTHPGQILEFGWSSRARLWFTLPNEYITKETVSDAFFILAVPLAIATHEDLFFEGAVSPEVLAQVDHMNVYFEDIYKRKLTVEVLATSQHKSKKRHVGQFFSIGVNSFYTLCCHHDKRDSTPRHIIYVDGYDIPHHREFLQELHKKITHVAKQTKTIPLFVQSNLRQISDDIIGWGRYQVSALVAVATMMDFKKMYISGKSFETLDGEMRFGAGTLYTTPTLKIKIIAHGVDRLQKLKAVLHSRYASLMKKTLDM